MNEAKTDPQLDQGGYPAYQVGIQFFQIGHDSEVSQDRLLRPAQHDLQASQRCSADARLGKRYKRLKMDSKVTALGASSLLCLTLARMLRRSLSSRHYLEELASRQRTRSWHGSLFSGRDLRIIECYTVGTRCITGL